MLDRGNYAELRRTRNSLIRAGRLEHQDWRIVASDRNLALDRPARQSSLSRFSRRARPGEPDPSAADARGANCGVLNESYGFHTDSEDHPWWAVDLQRNRLVDEVRIFAGRQCPERARRLVVETSADGARWESVFRAAADRVFAGNDDPLICRLASPILAAQVRVVLDGPGPLRLGEVEVYGPGGPND